MELSPLTTHQWLNEFYNTFCTELFKRAGYDVPALDKVDLLYSLPSKGAARGQKSQTAGEAWIPELNSLGKYTILLNPAIYIEDPLERNLELLGTLIHEVVHITVGNKHQHNHVFGKCARAVGLTGPMTSTRNSDELTAQITVWLTENGLCPAGALDLTKRKRQSTRMLKAECEPCNYIVRASKTQLMRGMPLCGCCGERMTLAV